MTTDRDYYEILGVERGADATALKNAYRKLAKQYHPDCEGGSEATFKELNEAYAVLSDGDKRAAYDRYGKAGVNGAGGPGGFTDFSDIFSEVFGDTFGDFFGGRGGGRRGPPRGADLRFDLEITLDQAFSGFEREIRVASGALCEPCKGSGGADGATPETCKTCGGAGQVASGGMFRIVRSCPACGGAGQTIRNPCRSCGGAGVARKERKLSVKIPAGVEDGMRIRLGGEGDAAPARRPNPAISTSSCRSSRTRCSSATGRTCSAARPYQCRQQRWAAKSKSHRFAARQPRSTYRRARKPGGACVFPAWACQHCKDAAAAICMSKSPSKRQ